MHALLTAYQRLSTIESFVRSTPPRLPKNKVAGGTARSSLHMLLPKRAGNFVIPAPNQLRTHT